MSHIIFLLFCVPFLLLLPFIFFRWVGFFLVSADWTTESDERCAQVGFDGVLRKPIILSALDDFLSSIVNSDEFSLSPPSSPLPQKQEQQQGGGGGGTTPDPPGWQIIGCRPVSTGEAACTGGS